METNLLPTKFQFSLILTMMLHITYAQVGIGTVTPDPSSLLQVDDANGNKGMLIPSVALTATNLSAPITPAYWFTTQQLQEREIPQYPLVTIIGMAQNGLT